jgi:deoxycytidine triphosphate deaminase
MEYKGIIITGPSGVGKSAVARKLCERYNVFQIVTAVTTRKPRHNDHVDQYKHISEEEFTTLDKNHKLLIKAEYRGSKYGITKESFESVVKSGKIPVMIVTPESVEKITNESFLSIFLDAPDDILNERLESRGESVNETTLKLREEDRRHIESCLYAAKNIEIERTIELLLYLWEYRNSGGVLPERIIRLMIDCGMLLDTGEDLRKNNIQGASYDLSLGDEYYGGGKIKKLTDREPFLLIEPYDYAIVTSKENANFPRDISGRFDLSVSLFCQGVILSNGPQVDPGFKGKLFCLLFNTSNTPVVLKRGQHYATLEFHKLIEPTTPYKGKYQGELRIINYLPSNTLRGAVSELRKELEKVKTESRKLQTIVLGTIGALLTIVALLLALR